MRPLRTIRNKIIVAVVVVSVVPSTFSHLAAVDAVLINSCGPDMSPPTTTDPGTLVLADGFESNDFGEWTTAMVGGDGTATVQTDTVYGGQCAAKLHVTSNTASKANLRKTLPAGTGEVWANGWFTVLAEGTNVNSNVPFLSIFSGSTRVITVFRKNETGELYLKLPNVAGGWTYTQLGRRLGLNKWVEVKLHAIADANNSTIEVWLDQTKVYTNGTVPLGATGLDTIMVGPEYAVQEGDLVADDIVVKQVASSTPTPTSANTSTPTAMVTDVPAPTVTPVLTSTATPTSTPTGGTIILAGEADAVVVEAYPDKNYGAMDALRVDGGTDPDVESYLRFSVAGVVGTIQSAKVRVYAFNGTIDAPAIYTTSNEWSESDITWNNRPARTTEPLADVGLTGINSWVEYDVTPAVTGNGTFSFVLASKSTDAMIAYSGEAASNRPELHLAVSGSAIPSPMPTSTPIPTSAASTDAVLVGAGDIAACDTLADEATANLLDTIPGTVFTTGDNVYQSGTATEFANCYDPSWGRHKARTRPSAGNHDYKTTGASAYFNYFGATAGESDKGYYSYDLGAWHVVVLNSNCAQVEGCEAGSPQEHWLRADLAASTALCTVAYWHHPRFSSGSHGSYPEMQAFWQALYEYGADVVLAGHDHSYERFAPQDPSGKADASYGMREFVVGTGGSALYTISTPLPNSEVRNSDTHGILKLTLHQRSYDWEFLAKDGKTFSDMGSVACHGAPPTP